MDILDVIMAKALTSDGQAEQAAAAAEAAAQEAIAAVQGITETVDTEINKLVLSLTTTNLTENNEIIGVGYNLVTTFPDGETVKTLSNIIRLYNSTGQNTNGTMSQKAISNYLSSLDQRATQIETDINLGSSNSGKIVVINANGKMVPGLTTEEAIIEAIINSDTYDTTKALGLEIDYANKSFTRLDSALNKTAGQAFDEYLMYGGRSRCNVSDSGEILAWCDGPGYAEDGSNGQVMIYQPKFYYKRVPTVTETHNKGGKIIRKESVIISYEHLNGFKLHPLFITPNGTELDYVFLSAYEGSAYINENSIYDLNDSSTIDWTSDKLSSISGAKPISGVNKNFNISNAEQMAQNRGSGWHITNLAAESALQMLELVEFGTLNGQNALEAGVVNITNVASYNCSSITGSTSNLQNATGHANSTTNETNGSYNTYSNAGRRAISYRGMENPWGNIWRMIGGLNIYGDRNNGGGKIYLCTNFNYTPTQISNNYEEVGFCLPSIFDWISAFGYVNSTYDWIFIPIECNNGTSALPIGDNLWTTAELNGINMGMIGGVWSYGEGCGPFYYAFDKSPTEPSRAYSARLMYIPQKDTIYYNNIAEWESRMGV